MRWVAVAISVAALVAGCGDDSSDGAAAGSGSVDTSRIEQQIESQLSGATVQIGSVSCPDDVAKEKGGTFQCKVKIQGGGAATAVVTQEDGNNSYSYAFKPGTLNVPGTAVEPVVEKELEAEGADVTAVNCPDNIVVKANSPVTCTAATASGAQIDVSFGFTSEGEVDPSTVESS